MKPLEEARKIMTLGGLRYMTGEKVPDEALIKIKKRLRFRYYLQNHDHTETEVWNWDDSMHFMDGEVVNLDTRVVYENKCYFIKNSKIPVLKYRCLFSKLKIEKLNIERSIQEIRQILGHPDTLIITNNKSIHKRSSPTEKRINKKQAGIMDLPSLIGPPPCTDLCQKSPDDDQYASPTGSFSYEDQEQINQSLYVNAKEIQSYGGLRYKSGMKVSPDAQVRIEKNCQQKYRRINYYLKKEDGSEIKIWNWNVPLYFRNEQEVKPEAVVAYKNRKFFIQRNNKRIQAWTKNALSYYKRKHKQPPAPKKKRRTGTLSNPSFINQPPLNIPCQRSPDLVLLSLTPSISSEIDGVINKSTIGSELAFDFIPETANLLSSFDTNNPAESNVTALMQQIGLFACSNQEINVTSNQNENQNNDDESEWKKYLSID